MKTGIEPPKVTGLNLLAKEVHRRNIEKGFWDDADNPRKIAVNLGLVHSEVSEAMECDRKDSFCEIDNENWNIGNDTLRDDLTNFDDLQFKKTFEMTVKDTFEDELADIIIRVIDLAAFKDIDLEKHIELKMRYNALREHKHGKNY